MTIDIDEAQSTKRSGKAATDDWSGLGDLLALGVQRFTAPVEGMQRAIADRWLRLAGPKGAPVREAYHGLTAQTYNTVRAGASTLGALVGAGAALVEGRAQVPMLWRTQLGSGVQSAVNAVWGDELERSGSHLSIGFGLRDHRGEPIDVDPVALATAYPNATPRLVVLLHGLGQTERCWLGRNDAPEPLPGLVEILEGGGFTPLLVRYNTGLHVSDNGAFLTELLERVTQHWPVPLEDIALVGLSMGGLVARSAIPTDGNPSHGWVQYLNHLITVGTPHLGAPLEKAANVVSWAMRRAAELKPLSEFLDRRSAGIKDLRYGTIREDDWVDTNPDGRRHDRAGDSLTVQGVQQHFVAGVVTTDPAHPVSVLFGDLVVRAASGTGRGRRRLIESTDIFVAANRRHFDLAHDPAVHDQITEWLTTPALSAPPRPALG